MKTLEIEIQRIDMHKTCWQSHVWFAKHPYMPQEITRAKTKKKVIEDVQKTFPDHKIKLIKNDWCDDY